MLKTIKEKNSPAEELFLIGILATFMGGYLDAYTYVLHDKIFANTQTGNLIFLTIDLFEKNFKEAFFRLFPIIFFFMGIILYEILNKFYKKYTTNISLIIQIILIILIGFGAFGNNSIIICGFISFICALQLLSFKKINGMPYATIMCTGNLRSFSEYTSKFILYKDKEYLKKGIIYFLIILTFCLGVFCGMFFVNILGRISVLILFVNILLKYLILHKYNKSQN